MSINHIPASNSLLYIVRCHPQPVIAIVDRCIVAASSSAISILCPSQPEVVEGSLIDQWLDTDLAVSSQSNAGSNDCVQTRRKLKNTGLAQIWIDCREIPQLGEECATLIFLNTEVSEPIVPSHNTSAVHSETTDPVNLKQVLLETENLYRTVFKTAKIGIVITDCNGGIIDANPEFQTFLGYTAEEISHLNLTDILDNNCYIPLIAKARNPDSDSDFEHTEEIQFKGKGGRSVWGELTSSRLNDLNGSVSLVLTLVRDVTAQQDSKAANKLNEELFRLVADNAQDIIFSTDQNEVITFMGGALERIFGIKPEELVGEKRSLVENNYHIHYDVEQQNYYQSIDTIFCTRGPESVFYEITTGTPDSLRCFEVRERIMRSKDGGFAGTSGTVTDITERFAHRSETRRQKKELRTIVDSIPACIFFVDKDFKVVWANDAYAKSAGKPLEQVVGSFLADLHPNVDRHFKNRFICEHRNILKLGRNIHNSIQPCLDIHDVKFIKFDKVPFRNDTDDIAGVLYVAEDATRQVKNEQHNIENEIRFRAIFDNAAIGIILADSNGCITLCNTSFQQMVGYSAEELHGKTTNHITHPDDVHIIPDVHISFQTAGISDNYLIEKRYIRKDGTTVWCRVSARTVQKLNLEALQIVACVEDITARKTAENSLAEVHKFTETVVARAGEGIVVIDPKMIVIAWNCFMEELSGISCLEAIGKKLKDLPPYLPEHCIKSDIKKVMSGNTVIIRDAPFRSSVDGSQKYVNVSYVPHINAENKIIGVIETIHDVTSLKLAIERLLKTNEELRKAYLTKKEFLNNVTHEVRTPLTAVQGYCEMLIEGIFGPVNQEQSEMLHRITDSSTQLLEIVNTILELTRLNSGLPSLSLKACNPGKLLEIVLTTTMPLAARKNLTINIADIPKDHLGMYDEQKCLLILTNILSNAIKFTECGNIDITMEIEQNSATLIVADTGIGIKDDQMAVIFDEFHQLDFPGKHKPSGFGIGLSLVATMVDIMGAELTVSSAYGLGTAFTLHIPAGELASVTD